MGFGWIEKFEQAGDRDVTNAQGYARSFIVEGYPLTTIMNVPGDVVNASGIALPLFGTKMDPASPATLESYALVATNKTTGGNIVHEVQARYSNDRRWRSAAPVNRFKVGQVRDTFQREKTTFDIPYAELEPVSKTTPNLTGPPTVTREDSYTPKTRTTPHVTYKRVKTVVIKNFVPSMLDLIAEQNDNIHKIDGRWLRFESGDAVPIDDDGNKYELEYIWGEDPGTKIIGGGSLGVPGSRLPPGTLVFPDRIWSLNDKGEAVIGTGAIETKFVRLPFHVLIPVFVTQTTQFSPDFIPFTTYVFNANGWTTLPGLNVG